MSIYWPEWTLAAHWLPFKSVDFKLAACNNSAGKTGANCKGHWPDLSLAKKKFHRQMWTQPYSMLFWDLLYTFLCNFFGLSCYFILMAYFPGYMGLHLWLYKGCVFRLCHLMMKRIEIIFPYAFKDGRVFANQKYCKPNLIYTLMCETVAWRKKGLEQ